MLNNIKTNLLKKLLFFLFFINFVFLNSSLPAFSQVSFTQEEQNFIKIYEKILPSTVSIEANIDKGTSGGTGCIISKNGIILTSSHVVENSKNIQVTTHSGKSYNAVVLAILRNKSDLALIKIEPKENLELVKFGNSDEVKVGQRVLALLDLRIL